MKNFGTLYRYELKKLIGQKLSWLIVIILSVFCIYAISKDSNGNVTTLESIDQNGNLIETDISGKCVLINSRDSARKINGQIMDDSFFAEMRRSISDIPNDKLREYFLLEDSTYYHVFTGCLEGLLSEPLSATSTEYYAARKEQMEAWWDNKNLSEGEKDYWREQASRIQHPMVYQRPWIGTNRLFDFYEILLRIVPLLAGVCLCRIFSEDHRTRVNALIFSSKKSRISLYLAKVLAGLTVVFFAAVFVIGVIMATNIAIWGTEGFGACVQMVDRICALPTTVGNIIFITLAWVVIYALLCGSVTMLLSLLTHSSSVAFIVSVVFMSYMSRVYSPSSQITDFLPYRMIEWNAISNVRLVNIFGIYLNHFQSGLLLYLIITILLLALCWLGWRRGALSGS